MSRGSEIIRNPELLLADILQREARGGDEKQSVHRAVVLAVDLEGGKMQNDSGQGSFTSGGKTLPAMVGVPNPRGSIKARILTNGFDRLSSDDEVRVFWPLFSYDQLGLPVSPGEHVYVMFEGSGFDHGLWISRVSGQDSANVFVGTDSYVAPSSPKTSMDSFERNSAEYPRDESYAGQAPDSSAMNAFGD